MISLHPHPNKLRSANNLIPRGDGTLYTRPGAVQIADGHVSQAIAWGNAVLMFRNGRLTLWVNGSSHDLGQAGKTLSAAPYQALVGDGLREDRLYFADGINPLRFIRLNGSAYEVVDVINSVLDDAGLPYPLPIPQVLCTWANRLWIGDGTNRIYHCQNERPDEWDPLWMLEFQGDSVSRVRAMMAHGGNLLVGLDNALWNVSGTSQYDWKGEEAVHGIGVVGPSAMVSDGQQFAQISKYGIHINAGASIADDLREMFRVPIFSASLAFDLKRRLLLVYIGGRLFVTHLDNPGIFTEIVQTGMAGTIATNDFSGWYGVDGLWMMGVINTGDQYMDYSRRDVNVRYDTWDVRPNITGSGRSLLSRLRLEVSGHPGAVAEYTVTSGLAEFVDTFTLSDDELTTWGQVPNVDPQLWPFSPVWRELCPRVAGFTFRHRIETNTFIQIHTFLPEYRFGVPQ